MSPTQIFLSPKFLPIRFALLGIPEFSLKVQRYKHLNGLRRSNTYKYYPFVHPWSGHSVKYKKPPESPEVFILWLQSLL